MAQNSKILFITSFYSALRSSFDNGAWQPTGMPAIAKLFEGLEKHGRPYAVVLINKSGAYSSVNRSEVRLAGLSSIFYVLGFPRYLATLAQWPFFSKICGALRGLPHLLQILAILRRGRFDVVYVDRENVVMGALLTLLGVRVVLRLHGVHDFYSRFNKWTSRLRYPLRLLSFRAPFSHIVSSEDGTPAEEFLEQFTAASIPKSLLLNGVDKMNSASSDVRHRYGIARDCPLILFVGRLDPGKGAESFVQSMKSLSGFKRKFSALLVGTGSLYERLKYEIQGYPNLILAGRVPHDEIRSFYEAADVYVSLNEYGNLSNTVLEALQAGTGIVTYGPDPATKRDYSTQRHLKDCAVLIDRARAQEDLPQQLSDLLAEPNRLAGLQTRARRQAEKILSSWDDRITEEIRIVEDGGQMDSRAGLRAVEYAS